MSDELRADAPHYHKQPHTQDPLVEIPDENVPLAQGHSDEQAAEVKQAADEHREQVQAEREQGEADEQANADYAHEQSAAFQQDPNAERAPEGTIDETMAWVGSDPERAQVALDQENAKPAPRSTLVQRLEDVVAQDSET